MKKAAIVTNFNITDKAAAALCVADRLHGLGCEVVVASFNREKISRQKLPKRDFISYLPVEKIYQGVDMIVVLGGDGTILDAARKAVSEDIPILGINLGRLGYMAELELAEIDVLERIVNGDYKLEIRSMINIEIIATDGTVRKNEYALNDAVLSNGTISRVVDLELYEGGVHIANYRSDGMIVATPTGSTAYSLAAGGAIVDPRLECLCVTPICPHSLYARPLIFPDRTTIEIKNTCQREKTLFLTVDGRMNYELWLGEKIRITRSPLTTRFIRLKDDSLYDRLRQKMNDN